MSMFSKMKKYALGGNYPTKIVHESFSIDLSRDTRAMYPTPRSVDGLLRSGVLVDVTESVVSS